MTKQFNKNGNTFACKNNKVKWNEENIVMHHTKLHSIFFSSHLFRLSFSIVQFVYQPIACIYIFGFLAVHWYALSSCCLSDGTTILNARCQTRKETFFVFVFYMPISLANFSYFFSSNLDS